MKEHLKNIVLTYDHDYQTQTWVYEESERNLHTQDILFLKEMIGG